ncbi:MAG: hypothetical protein II265_07375, partial [Clostridia bacterium]|nr:hypothetical protein [Clostridia bacterium]
MKYLLKEINEVLEASKHDTIIAIAFLHGLKTAIMLGLNIDENEEEKKEEHVYINAAVAFTGYKFKQRTHLFGGSSNYLRYKIIDTVVLA